MANWQPLKIWPSFYLKGFPFQYHSLNALRLPTNLIEIRGLIFWRIPILSGTLHKRHCCTMKLFSWSLALCGRPPTGFEAIKCWSVSVNQLSLSWISSWNDSASLRRSSSRDCFNSAFCSSSSHFCSKSSRRDWVTLASSLPSLASMMLCPASLRMSTLFWLAAKSFSKT